MVCAYVVPKADTSKVKVEIWTNAATTVGGGYYIPLLDFTDGSNGHFGQCLWSAVEKEIFGVAGLETTDINILEFITVILAIVTERKILKGRVVRFMLIIRQQSVGSINSSQNMNLGSCGWH